MMLRLFLFLVLVFGALVRKTNLKKEKRKLHLAVLSATY